MLDVVTNDDETQIQGFFEYIYGSEQGFVYVAHKVPENQYKFNQSFFEWPARKLELVQHVISHRTKFEVYYAPALFSSPSASKEQVRGASVFWCEFDGKVPESNLLADAGVPEPTLRIQSSDTGHEHWYWKLDRLVDTTGLERVNRAVTYMFGADTSGWDANQILRPPSTFNHKRARPVIATYLDKRILDPGSMSALPEPPPQLETPIPERIPDINNVILKYKFSETVAELFKRGTPVGQRSEGEMKLGYYLAEMNLTNEEMLSVLLNADERWGKFSGRSDQLKRLMEIITIARQKYPFSQTDQMLGVPELQPMGFLTALRSEIHIEWFWDGFLQKAGYMLLTGPSQVGKTQLALDVAASIALGKRALDATTNQGRIGFFSLEMNLAELKEFLMLMSLSFTPEEQEILEQKLFIFPLGEPLYLTKPEMREKIEQTVKDFELDGCIFDSLGSTTEGSLSDETSVKTLLDWNDSFRQRSGVFTWFIHHHRKANGDNKKPNKLSDVYGNQYITARATTVLCLWPTGVQNTLEVIPLKIRLRKNPGNFNIKRGTDLRFTRMVSGIVQEPGEALEEVEMIMDEELTDEEKTKKGWGI